MRFHIPNTAMAGENKKNCGSSFFVLLEVLNVNSAPKKSSKQISVMELWFSVVVFVFARL